MFSDLRLGWGYSPWRGIQWRSTVTIGRLSIIRIVRDSPYWSELSARRQEEVLGGAPEGAQRDRTARGEITVRAACWSATHPWRAITMWMVVVIACFAIGSATGRKESDRTARRSGCGERADHVPN